MHTRSSIRREVLQIDPLDQAEARAQRDVLQWIDSGADLCRIEKPATPPQHLISYFAVVDGDHLLLVDHIAAELWLPPGGHVEPDEHPKDTVRREAKEELSLEAEFLLPRPLLLSITETVGKTAGHIDVSLWYVLKGTRSKPLRYDRSEFHRAQWFHRDEVPFGRTDPQMGRFIMKLYQR